MRMVLVACLAVSLPLLWLALAPEAPGVAPDRSSPAAEARGEPASPPPLASRVERQSVAPSGVQPVVDPAPRVTQWVDVAEVRVPVFPLETLIAAGVDPAAAVEVQRVLLKTWRLMTGWGRRRPDDTHAFFFEALADLPRRVKAGDCSLTVRSLPAGWGRLNRDCLKGFVNYSDKTLGFSVVGQVWSVQFSFTSGAPAPELFDAIWRNERIPK